MSIKKKIKIAVLSILGITLVLFAVLVHHIANARPIENANIQISRIDFDQPFDSLSTIQIKEKLHSIQGVKSDIIVKNNVVVYFHDNTVADSKKVFDELMTKGDYKAQRFILPATMANNQVCPVMKKDSFKYKFSKWVQKHF
ncbi:hypothetical protein [Flavobacterium sp.]|uniref:hypothetical protein n=1 Tax=Flavobacterium sp. TaxID=239 RepID=UPI002B4B3906|nr:hypothetical protein [Flavobacterium sp.]HLP64183.1 hypothetical protein [Flavobacterium sp.]